ncbi:MAG TPA: META domain-containing protein [Chitinophagaceae bacterium]|nr:META domain-containing protein [Chitinophagaceae bacterium]
MSYILKLSTALFICFFVIACGQSRDEEGGSNQNAISTNTAENPLTIPPNPVSTTSTSQTIYAVWVLDSVNNKLIDSTHYSGRGKPYFNFNLEKKSLSGFTGCGGINGKLKTQGEKLIFDNLVVTGQDCKIKDFEKKIVMGFKNN